MLEAQIYTLKHIKKTLKKTLGVSSSKLGGLHPSKGGWGKNIPVCVSDLPWVVR